MNGSRLVDVGAPLNDFSGWTTTEVRFHNYTDLSIETDEYEESPVFSSLGYMSGDRIFILVARRFHPRDMLPSIFAIGLMRASKLSSATVLEMPLVTKCIM